MQDFVDKCDVLRLLKNSSGHSCLKTLLDGCEIRSYQQGEPVVLQGEKRDAFLFVKSGNFEIVGRRNERRADRPGVLLGQGDTLVGKGYFID